MTEQKRQAAVKVGEHYHRGLLTADEACGVFLLAGVDPCHVAECVGLLPDDLRAALPEFLQTLPTSDDGWARDHKCMELDGDEWSWARMVVDCRAAAEVVREYVLGEPRPPAAPDFVDRVRAAYRERFGG